MTMMSGEDSFLTQQNNKAENRENPMMKIKSMADALKNMELLRKEHYCFFHCFFTGVSRIDLKGGKWQASQADSLIGNLKKDTDKKSSELRYRNKAICK